MVNVFIHLINMQIMQNPQWGFLETHKIFNQSQNRNESGKNQLSTFFSMFTMVSWLMLLYYYRPLSRIRHCNPGRGWRLMGVMCNTSQCVLRSTFPNLRVTNVIHIVTYYTLPPLESPTSSWMTRPQRSRRRDKGLWCFPFNFISTAVRMFSVSFLISLVFQHAHPHGPSHHHHLCCCHTLFIFN